MIITDDQEACVGCSLCAEICPKKCITMRNGSDGFLYPHIDEQECVKCEKCKTYCPVNKEARKITPLASYALKDKDTKARLKSASGGAFGVFATAMINEGGAYTGVRLDETMTPISDLDSCCEKIDLYRDSKYIQSDMKPVWGKISTWLKSGKRILVTGTPCQIAAVHSYFGDRDQLILCDLVCNGVPDPKMFKLHIKDLEKQYGKKVKNFYFRDKTNGWVQSNVRLVFEDDSQVIMTRNESDFFKLFGLNIILRESCYHCKFKESNVYSDLTIGDYWGIDEINAGFNDDLGCSLVMINTEKGRSFFKSATGNCDLFETPVEFAFKTHPKLLISVKRNPYRKLFYETVSKGKQNALKKAIKKVRGSDIFNKVYRKIYLKLNNS